jgi:heterogeneous nuclear ribonucleoprotein A1/A3
MVLFSFSHVVQETTRSDSRGGIKKVFVGGIGQDTDEFHLRDHFSKYGRVENASIMTDKDTGKSRGFGFVVFEECDPADRCSGMVIKVFLT